MAHTLKGPAVWPQRAALLALALATGIAAYHFASGDQGHERDASTPEKTGSAGTGGIPKPTGLSPVSIASRGDMEVTSAPQTLADASGKLTDEAAEGAALSEGEKVSVQDALDYLWQSARESTAARVAEVKEEADAEKGVRVYRIPAAQDRGKGMVDDLKIKLKGAVGDKRGMSLWKSLDMTGPFGGFGRFDVILEFQYPQDGDKDQPTVNFAYVGPSSGGVDSKGTISVEEMQEKFGGVIIVPDAPEKPPVEEPEEVAGPDEPGEPVEPIPPNMDGD